VAGPCAACTGRRSTGSSVAVPSVTRVVSGATAASMTSVSMRGLSTESLAHTEA
jgi:hypothetical protein